MARSPSRSASESRASSQVSWGPPSGMGSRSPNMSVPVSRTRKRQPPRSTEYQKPSGASSGPPGGEKRRANWASSIDVVGVVVARGRRAPGCRPCGSGAVSSSQPFRSGGVRGGATAPSRVSWMAAGKGTTVSERDPGVAAHVLGPEGDQVLPSTPVRHVSGREVVDGVAGEEDQVGLLGQDGGHDGLVGGACCPGSRRRPPRACVRARWRGSGGLARPVVRIEQVRADGGVAEGAAGGRREQDGRSRRGGGGRPSVPSTPRAAARRRGGGRPTRGGRRSRRPVLTVGEACRCAWRSRKRSTCGKASASAPADRRLHLGVDHAGLVAHERQIDRERGARGERPRLVPHHLAGHAEGGLGGAVGGPAGVGAAGGARGDVRPPGASRRGPGAGRSRGARWARPRSPRRRGPGRRPAARSSAPPARAWRRRSRARRGPAVERQLVAQARPRAPPRAGRCRRGRAGRGGSARGEGEPGAGPRRRRPSRAAGAPRPRRGRCRSSSR